MKINKSKINNFIFILLDKARLTKNKKLQPGTEFFKGI